MLTRGDGRRRLRAPTFDSRASRRVLGLITMIAIVAGIIVAVVRPNPFASKTSVWAEFKNVNGLGRIDRDIRIAGVNSGEIGDVERIGDHAIVKLELDGDVQLKRDARAELRPHTLFEGSAFIDLHPGSPSAPPLGDGVIRRSHTRVYVSLDDALRLLRKPVRESLRALAKTGAKTLDDPRTIRGLRKTLKGAPALTKELGPTARALRGPHGTELSKAIRGMATTVDAVASQSDQLIPLAQRTDRTLAALDVNAGNALDAALAVLPASLAELAEGGGELTAVIDRLDALSVALPPALRELAPAMRIGRPILRRATPILRRSTPLIGDLGTVLGRFSDAAPVLTRTIGAVKPGVNLIARSVSPYLAAENGLGVPRYLQLASAFTAGTGSERPYQTIAQNPLGAGHLLRLGGYFDNGGTLGSLTKPPCSFIAALDAGIAATLQSLDLCAV